jgi:protease IV
MSIETEAVLDRRRIRRNLSLWRGAAVVALLLAGAALLGKGDGSGFIPEKQIARVTIDGTITESRDQLKMLKKIEEDDNVKAVILFVNSPGGTTTGGEALYEQVREIAKKKPVVAQFGTLAASAGYIVGLSADHIVARGNTITGSVGVIMQWPEVTELLNKIGVNMKEVKSGDLKAAPNPYLPSTPESMKVLKDMVSDGYRWFITLVEERRGIKAADVPGLEQGRIFSGRDALTHKLIDEIGGEAEAIRWLEDKRSIEKELKVVDWKPSEVNAFGFSSVISGVVTGLFGESASAVTGLLAKDKALATVGLDGMVSVWHPSEN